MILIHDGRNGRAKHRNRSTHLTVGHSAIPQHQPILPNTQLRAVLCHTPDPHPPRRSRLDNNRRRHARNAKDHVQPGGR